MDRGGSAVSHSLIAADRGTHFRIVLVSLTCAVAFIAAAVVASQATRDETARADGAPVIKAGKPTAVTSQDNVLIR